MSTNGARILVVDDDGINRTLLSTLLKNEGFTVDTAENGARCLEELGKKPFDIILLDLHMPEMDGYGVLEAMRGNRKMSKIPVIVISASDSMEDIIKSINMGAADHLPKPFDPVLLKARLNATLKAKLLQDRQENYRQQLERRVKDQVRQIEESLRKAQQTLEKTVLALSSVVEIRDIYTAGHQQRVAQLSCAIAEKLGLPKSRIEGIQVSAILHDIGKIAVPAEILSKPGKLHEAEFEVIKLHCDVAHKVLRTIDFPWPVPEIVLQHHEKSNGLGYPQGLQGKDLLLESRIIQVSDVVEAMTSHRPYRPALGREAAEKEVKTNKGLFYDPEVVDAYLALKDFRFEFS